MLKYILQDLRWALSFLPYGLLAAGILFLFFLVRNTGRMKRGKETQPLMASVCFCTYLLIIFCLTLLSRENGSTSKIDLELGSTLKINVRNTIYYFYNYYNKMFYCSYRMAFVWAGDSEVKMAGC